MYQQKRHLLYCLCRENYTPLTTFVDYNGEFKLRVFYIIIFPCKDGYKCNSDTTTSGVLSGISTFPTFSIWSRSMTELALYSSQMISHFLLFRFNIFRASTLSDNSLFFSIFLTSSKNQFRF